MARHSRGRTCVIMLQCARTVARCALRLNASRPARALWRPHPQVSQQDARGGRAAGHALPAHARRAAQAAG